MQKCCYWVTHWLQLSLLSYSPDPPSFVEMLLSRVTSCINHQLRHIITDLATGQSSLGSSSVEVLFPGDIRLCQVDNRNSEIRVPQRRGPPCSTLLQGLTVVYHFCCCFWDFCLLKFKKKLSKVITEVLFLESVFRIHKCFGILLTEFQRIFRVLKRC